MIRLLVLIYGGIWKVQKRRREASNFIIKKYYSFIFKNFMKQHGSFVGISAEVIDPVFPHDILGIFISGGAKIGKNCVIFHQVTIGSNNLPDSKHQGSPIIGENCYIGAGAKIIGNIRVGDNVRIGANCVVVKDVPSNSVIVNQPARVIQKKNLQNDFKSL